jgi:hypothetical protein
MTGLEHIIYSLYCAVEKDEIGKAELLRWLIALHNVGDDIIMAPSGEEPESLLELNQRIHKRFGIMLTGGELEPKFK